MPTRYSYLSNLTDDWVSYNVSNYIYVDSSIPVDNYVNREWDDEENI